ncbi:MAG: hypothetical protein K2W94_08400, partial [Alphaproteobacteria bacterium]|nr:hypothetical protein [Alphaproteobacteria bacterium]
MDDNGRVVRFKGFDYAYKTTDSEREVLAKPLIDVAIRLKNAGSCKALADFFSRQTRNLANSYTSWQATSEENKRKVFYHQLTALALSALAIGDGEKLTLNSSIQALFDKRKTTVAGREWFQNALESVTGLKGEIRQVKAYAKKRPEAHLVLGVNNNEDRLERFNANWVFLNNEPHDSNKGRCLTVDFNDL